MIISKIIGSCPARMVLGYASADHVPFSVLRTVFYLFFRTREGQGRPILFAVLTHGSRVDSVKARSCCRLLGQSLPYVAVYQSVAQSISSMPTIALYNRSSLDWLY